MKITGYFLMSEWGKRQKKKNIGAPTKFLNEKMDKAISKINFSAERETYIEPENTCSCT